MEFAQRFEVPLAREAVWDIVMDVHRVTQCIDGVERLEIKSPDAFEGTLAVKMGPVRLAFEGTVTVTSRARDQWSASLMAAAKDRKAGGGFTAELTIELVELGPDLTGLDLRLSTSLTGRIGQLGRPLIKKRVERILENFGTTLLEREVGNG